MPLKFLTITQGITQGYLMYCVPITKSWFREKILNKGNKKIFVCWAHSEADSQDKGLALRYAPLDKIA